MKFLLLLTSSLLLCTFTLLLITGVGSLIHIYFLIGFRNRLVVLIDWAWSYWTFARHARVVARYALLLWPCDQILRPARRATRRSLHAVAWPGPSWPVALRGGSIL